MRITGIHERPVPISRFGDPGLPTGGLDTSIVAITTDAVRDGRAVVGYGFSSVGRFAQSGLIRERFAPRLMAAAPLELLDAEGRIDPARAWSVMMAGEKLGGHGERCVAVGTLDMALWDIAAKMADLPLHGLLARLSGRAAISAIPVYAAGGYRYPAEDLSRLQDELLCCRDQGYRQIKIKIGTTCLAEDIRRVKAACKVFPAENVAVDAMNAYGPRASMAAASALGPFGLMWFEDVCDPLDFETQAMVADSYPPPIAAGEALFSEAEAKLLDQHGGLRRDRDVLLFDPVHCYGLPEYTRIVLTLLARGWPSSAFWPHGGHLFSLHVAAGLGLGGAEMNPGCFLPFGGPVDRCEIRDGAVPLPDAPGIGFECKKALMSLFDSLV